MEVWLRREGGPQCSSIAVTSVQGNCPLGVGLLVLTHLTPGWGDPGVGVAEGDPQCSNTGQLSFQCRPLTHFTPGWGESVV